MSTTRVVVASLVLVLVLAACGTAEQSQRKAAATPTVATTTTPGAEASEDTGSAVVDRRVQRERRVARVVRDFYAAITEQRYDAAWSSLSPALQARLGGFAAWKGGYATTLSSDATRVSASSSSEGQAIVDVTLRSRDRDACGDAVVQHFAGSWQLALSNGRWRARSIALRKTAGTTPVATKSACPKAADAGGDDASSSADPETSNEGADTREVCLPETRLPAVHLPKVRLPAVTLPAFTDYNGVRHPTRRIPGRTIPGRTIAARTIGGECFNVPASFAPERTSVLAKGYEDLDRDYSPTLTGDYWRRAGRSTLLPDYSASGFGETNAAGFPKNQYVRSYVRRDGTYVSGYWRNSPTDGLPTCRIIGC